MTTSPKGSPVKNHLLRWRFLRRVGSLEGWLLRGLRFRISRAWRASWMLLSDNLSKSNNHLFLLGGGIRCRVSSIDTSGSARCRYLVAAFLTSSVPNARKRLQTLKTSSGSIEVTRSMPSIKFNEHATRRSSFDSKACIIRRMLLLKQSASFWEKRIENA